MDSDNDGKILRDLERARVAQESEVKYRNEKRWKIFSWSSSLLLGSIAGAVAIKKTDDLIALSWELVVLVNAKCMKSLFFLLNHKKPLRCEKIYRLPNNPEKITFFVMINPPGVNKCLRLNCLIP
jgi:hypothetical protein